MTIFAASSVELGYTAKEIHQLYFACNLSRKVRYKGMNICKSTTHVRKRQRLNSGLMYKTFMYNEKSFRIFQVKF